MNEKTLFYLDPALTAYVEISALMGQLGLPVVRDSGRAHVRISPERVSGALSFVEGHAFSVSEECATFDAAAIKMLLRYRREARALTIGGWTFPVSVDGCAKGGVIHAFTETLFSFVLRHRPISFLWFFPRAARGVANYRVDVDDDRKDSVQRVREQVGAHAPWTSWYFSTASFEDDPAPIIRCRDSGAEVGTHAHFHCTYEHDGKSNARNVRASLAFLRRFGINATSYVTPSAKSYAGIGKLMAEEGLAYTSNFGMISDALPLRFQDGRCVYLEVPIHPICPGNLSRATPSKEAADIAWSVYVRRTARKLAASFLPIFFYGHNNDNYELTYLSAFLDFIVREFPEHERVTLGAYARFWTRRLERQERFAEDDSDENVATILPEHPHEIVVTHGAAVKRYAYAPETFLRPPETYQPFAMRQSPYERLLMCNEYERIVPIRLISPMSWPGLSKICYKIVSPVCKILIRPFRRFRDAP